MTTLTQTDERQEVTQLVRDAQAGDRAAFGQLFERFERHVTSIALRRLGNYAEAEELCQDVFIQAMLKIGQLRTPEAFGGWLRQITHRMAINRAVRRGPDLTIEPETLEATCVENATPLAAALKVERDAQLREGLDRLGVMDRDTLVAFYVQGQSLIEMSDAFDAPIGTIKRRLHVARKRLAKQVEHLTAV